MPLIKTDLSELGIVQKPNGWWTFDPTVLNPSKIQDEARKRVMSLDGARHKLASRRKGLLKVQVDAESSPSRGVAVKEPAVRSPRNWHKMLLELFYKHYPNASRTMSMDGLRYDENLDMELNQRHEMFQASKMGYFGPWKGEQLTQVTNEYVELTERPGNSTDHLEEIKLAGLLAVAEVDFGHIPNGSLRVVSNEAAVMDANIHGGAGGVFQMNRYTDIYGQGKNKQWKVLSRDVLDAVMKTYGLKIDFRQKEIKLYDILIQIADKVSIKFKPSDNMVTIFYRIQVGGNTYLLDREELDNKDNFNWAQIEDAKVRPIMANDPVYQVFCAKVVQAWKKSLIDNNVLFRSSVFPSIEEQVKAMNDMYEYMFNNDLTAIPYDFSKHDAYIRGEWYINMLLHVVRPKFHPDDWKYVDFMVMTVVCKVFCIPVPGESKFVWKLVTGGLDSGHPNTAEGGSTMTRGSNGVAAHIRGDVFVMDRKAGQAKGDDLLAAARKSVIASMDFDSLHSLYDEVCEIIEYKINAKKQLVVRLEDGQIVGHWDQAMYYYNPVTQRTMQLGSVLRYMGKIYMSEDYGRNGTYQGIMDQISVAGNPCRYLGDGVFSVSALHLESLIAFRENDKVLDSLIENQGPSFMKVIVRKAAEEDGIIIKDNGTFTNTDGKELDPEVVASQLQHRFRAYDSEKLKDLLNGKYLHSPVVWLLGLDKQYLKRVAEANLGRVLLIRIGEENGGVKFLNLHTTD
jgi:hypothetical protein